MKADFTVNWDPEVVRLSTLKLNNWIVTLTKPSGEKVVVDQHTTNPSGPAALGMALDREAHLQPQ